MPSWFNGMTAEDHERNLKEMREQQKSEAESLRAQARFLLAQAERLDPTDTERSET